MGGAEEAVAKYTKQREFETLGLGSVGGRCEGMIRVCLRFVFGPTLFFYYFGFVFPRVRSLRNKGERYLWNVVNDIRVNCGIE